MIWIMELGTVAAMFGTLVAGVAVFTQWSTAKRNDSTSDRRAREDRFHAERLSAYSAFVGAARTAYRQGWRAQGSRTGEPDLPDGEATEISSGGGKPIPSPWDLSPGDVNASLSDLAAPIRLLNPHLAQSARDVIVGITLFLDDVKREDWDAARLEDPFKELNDFEDAAAADLAMTPRDVPESKRKRRLRA
ncbi:hypothetical protein ACFVTZ_02210 [Cellulosimicrobium cellulans]|uniref:hypothetical protein n=1 Tax=Cellulosimicrobium cellulans TaxID=1710 RepID=UPI0036EA37A7